MTGECFSFFFFLVLMWEGGVAGDGWRGGRKKGETGKGRESQKDDGEGFV